MLVEDRSNLTDGASDSLKVPAPVSSVTKSLEFFSEFLNPIFVLNPIYLSGFYQITSKSPSVSPVAQNILTTDNNVANYGMETFSIYK